MECRKRGRFRATRYNYNKVIFFYYTSQFNVKYLSNGLFKFLKKLLILAL